MTHGVLDVLEGHAGAEQLGGEAVSQAVGAEPAGCGDAGLASHATDQGVAGRVREPGGAVPVEKDRPGRAGPDAVLERPTHDGGERLGRGPATLAGDAQHPVAPLVGEVLDVAAQCLVSLLVYN